MYGMVSVNCIALNAQLGALLRAERVLGWHASLHLMRQNPCMLNVSSFADNECESQVPCENVSC